MWDGIDLRDLDLAGLRDRINAAFKDYMAYELSATDNIAVGDLGRAADHASLAAAATPAGLHVLAALPKGYDTMLTRSFYDMADQDDPATGVRLSGGQWQRLALARAFLRGGRDLVILDEPSSGLDAEAESVPPGRFLVLGDNPARSLDSRQLGYIPADRLVGVALRRLPAS